MRRPISQLFRMSGAWTVDFRRADRRGVLRPARLRDLALLARRLVPHRLQRAGDLALRPGGGGRPARAPRGDFRSASSSSAAASSARDLIRDLAKADPAEVRLLGVFDDRGDARSPVDGRGLRQARQCRRSRRIRAPDAHRSRDLRAADHRRAAHPPDAAQALGAADRHPPRRARQPLRFRPRSYSYLGAAPMLDVFDKPLARLGRRRQDGASTRSSARSRWSRCRRSWR